MKVAFYKGYGSTWWKRVISWLVKVWTGGPYSHVELVDTNDSKAPRNWTWYSASSFDEGEVRIKSVDCKCHHWDVWEVVGADEQAAFDFIKSQVGKKYDWLGIFLTQVLPLDKHDHNKWFCSEICHAALVEAGVCPERGQSHKFNPNQLFERMLELKVLRN